MLYSPVARRKERSERRACAYDERSRIEFGTNSLHQALTRVNPCAMMTTPNIVRKGEGMTLYDVLAGIGALTVLLLIGYVSETISPSQPTPSQPRPINKVPRVEPRGIRNSDWQDDEGDC